MENKSKLLEKYTLTYLQEVLLVTIKDQEEEDQIAIYRGFSSSLMRPTAFDPDEPIMSSEAEIISIDRLRSPYNPDAPQYIQQGLSWNQMQEILAQAGIG